MSKFMNKSDEEKNEAIEKVRKIIQTFGGHFTIEGSFQNKGTKGFETCDFQGCETNDWAAEVPANVRNKAFAKMVKCLADCKAQGNILAGKLIDELEKWERLEASNGSEEASDCMHQEESDYKKRKSGSDNESGGMSAGKKSKKEE